MIFGRDVLSLDKTDFAQTAMKAGQIGRHPVRRFAIEESTSGIARRCARATTDHAGAVLPSSAMNSRRLIR